MVIFAEKAGELVWILGSAFVSLDDAGIEGLSKGYNFGSGFSVPCLYLYARRAR